MKSWLRRVPWLPALPYIFLGYAIRFLIAMVAVHPFVSLVDKTIGGWPAGDRMLFEPGGMMLAEVVRLHGPAVSSLVEQSALFGLGMIPIGFVLATFVLASLVVEPPRTFRKVGALAIDRFLPIASLTAVQVLLVAGTLLLAYVLREGARSALASTFELPTSDLLSLVVILIGIGIAALVMVLLDVARVSCVRSGFDAAQSVMEGLTLFRRSPWSLCMAFCARASAGVFLVVASVSASFWIGVSTDFRAGLVLLIQQGTLILLACLRASWFGRVMELLAQEKQRAPTATTPGKSPSTDAPTDPIRDPGSSPVVVDDPTAT